VNSTEPGHTVQSAGSALAGAEEREPLFLWCGEEWGSFTVDQLAASFVEGQWGHLREARVEVWS
jgi:hypothetical protein